MSTTKKKANLEERKSEESSPSPEMTSRGTSTSPFNDRKYCNGKYFTFDKRKAIHKMTNWIKNVGKPALDAQDELMTQLLEKDNEWRLALVDLEYLKDRNQELQDAIRKRPTNQQHECEKVRAAGLSQSIRELEQDL